MTDFISPEEAERHRDDHALACERFAMALESIDASGSVGDRNTHEVIAGDIAILGRLITAVGTNVTSAAELDQHAAGEQVLDEVQRIRAAILFSTANAITETYDSGLDSTDKKYGEVARYGLRGSGIYLPNGDTAPPLLIIARSDTTALRERGSLLHNWMARMLKQVNGDPYYDEFWP